MTDTITAPQTLAPFHLVRHQRNPGRPLDWLWQRAEDLVAKGEPPDPYWDAPLVCAAHAFLVARHRGDEPDSAAADIIHAEQIQLDGGLLRTELQARILAHRNIEDAAAATNLPVPVVLAYEQLLFHVLDRVDKHRFILDQVIRKPEVMDLKDVATMWKFWAYSSGPEILDDIINDFRQLRVADYQYLINGSVPKADRSSLGRAIDRSMLVMCIPKTPAGFQALQQMALMASQLQDGQLPREAEPETDQFWDAASDMLDEAFEALAKEAVQEYWAEAS